MRKLILSGVVLAASACGSSAVDQAQEMAAHDLADPASAQFREVAAIPGDCVAGELNAKNRMGGYTGFRKFVVDLKKKEVAITPDATSPEDLDAALGAAKVATFAFDCSTRAKQGS